MKQKQIKDCKRIDQFETHFACIGNKLEEMFEFIKRTPDTVFAKNFYDITDFLQYCFCQALCQLSHIEKPSKYSAYKNSVDESNTDESGDDYIEDSNDENNTFDQVKKYHTYMRDIDTEIAHLHMIASNISDKTIAREYIKIVNYLMEVYVHALNILRSISFEPVRLNRPFDCCNSKLN